MTSQQKSSKAIPIILWIAQLLLATVFLTGCLMKLFQPVEELSALWPWTAQVPLVLVKFTGIVDLLAATGLVLPSLLRIQPKLTPIAAVCIIVLMLCAITFHIIRGEASVTGGNIVFTLIAAFIAWGRFIKEPITSR